MPQPFETSVSPPTPPNTQPLPPEFCSTYRHGGGPILATIVTLALAFSLMPLSANGAIRTAADPGADQLVNNHDFAAGTVGWRSNSSAQRLQAAPGPAIRLTTTRTSGAVLNDVTNTVRQAPKGQTYTVTARVRTTTPTVNGAVRVREVTSNNTKTHRRSFNLRDTSWKTISFDLTTAYAGASLDLNVLAWVLPKGHTLIVDYVSMKKKGTPNAAPPEAAPPANQNTCTGTPSRDTVFGSSLDASDPSPASSLARVDSAFGRVPIVRDFHPGMPSAWSSPRSKALRDRQVVISFAASPNSILSGRHDAYLKRWFETAPTDQTIYWSYMHEPEVKIRKGEFTAAQFRSAWIHIDRIADRVCKPNMYSTLILTQWTFDPLSGRNWRDYDAGKNVIDALAFDPYNEWRVPAKTTYTDVDDLLSPIAKAMKADGRPWGLAELGSRVMRGDNGVKRAAWLTEVGAFLQNNDASFATYFHTTYNGTSMRLDEQYSRRAWADLVAS